MATGQAQLICRKDPTGQLPDMEIRYEQVRDAVEVYELPIGVVRGVHGKRYYLTLSNGMKLPIPVGNYALQFGREAPVISLSAVDTQRVLHELGVDLAVPEENG